MEFVTLKPEHVMALKDFIDVHAGYEVDQEMADEISKIGGYAAIADGEVIAVGGVMPQLWGGGLAWAWMSRRWRKYARATTEGVNKILDESKYERIEAGILADFKAGHSWAKRLGFYMETPLARKWGPDMKDYSIYARVK